MTKSDLINLMSDRLNISKKEVSNFFDHLQEIITECLEKKEKIIIGNLGTMQLRFRNETNHSIPKSDKIVNVPAHYVPFFKIRKKFKLAFQHIK
jgi:nucleoid DNA-binding protein